MKTEECDAVGERMKCTASLFCFAPNFCEE